MPQSAHLVESLTSRELEVLGLVAAEKKDRAIATELGISERTVRAHVARIILKLQVRSRLGAAVALAEWQVTRHGTPEPRP